MQHLGEDLQVRWLKLRIKLKEKFGIKPDMNGVLLLIGIQELGKGRAEYSKEEKARPDAHCRLYHFNAKRLLPS